MIKAVLTSETRHTIPKLKYLPKMMNTLWALDTIRQ